MSRSRRIILLCAVAAVAFGQQFRSTIGGVVNDPTGATIAAAKVTATQVETGTKTETVSTSDGRYTLNALLPGTYRIDVDAAGFKHFVRQGLKLDADQHLNIDLNLQVGQVSETVSVTADTPLLNTDNASMGQVIDTKSVQDLPLNGRSPLMLANLAPGVVATSTTENVHPFDNGGESSWAMGGGGSGQNELMVDGNEDTRMYNNQVAYSPPEDAVQQVIVDTFNVDPGYGHTGGGTINVITKQGTNDLHGSAYEFNQTSALDANDWALDKAGQPKPVTRQNQYGMTAGAPIVIPKLFNGKNKLFWYFAFEGIRNNTPESYDLTVPTALERQGNFSQLLALGPQYQLYNPFTAVTNSTGVVISRQPFAGNIIPPSLINPVAAKILSYIPLPNQPGTAIANEDNYTAGGAVNTFDNELGRIDYNLSENQKIYLNVRRNLRNEYDLNWFNNPASGRTDDRTNWGSTLDYVDTITPTLVLDTRLNFTRFEDDTFYGNGSQFNPTTLGLPSSLAANSSYLAFPAINLGGTFVSPGPNSGSGTVGGATSEGNDFPEQSWQLYSNATKVTGAHTFKFGADLRQYSFSSFNPGYSSGLLTFASSSSSSGSPWTGATPTASAALGQELSAFLLGLPASGELDNNATGYYREDYIAFFAQDDWRLKPNLTLNLGVRFDHDFPITERYNRNVNGFGFGTANPIQAAAQAAYAADYAKNPSNYPIPPNQFATPGGLTFASSSNPDVYETQSNIFSPRLGFAWTPAGANGKTVLRGGFGIFVFPLSIAGGSSSPIQQPGFSTSTPITATLNNYATPYATLSNPFPNGVFNQPSGSSLGLATFLGQGITFYNPKPLNPYSERWNFDVQRQVGGNFLFDIGYEGNHGVHLSENQNINAVPIQYLSTSNVRNAAQNAAISYLTTTVKANPLNGLVPGSSLNTGTTTFQQLLLPYPEFTGVTELGVNDGSSYYEAGFVSIQKRLSHGWQFIANYTHSRLENRTVRLNAETALIKMISPDDRPNHFVFSTNYDLPFGRGKLFGSNTNGVVQRLIGGWSLNGIITYESGAPLSWGNVIYLGGPIDLNPHNTQATFNTAAFDRVASDQPSDNIRTFPQYFSNLRADSIKNTDFSVIKNIAITEHIPLELRFEFFNLFNHPTYNTPNLSPTSTAFGTITGDELNNARIIQLGAHIRW